MEKTLITLLLIACTLPAALAQDRIYRCGSEYTNNTAMAKERGCKPLEGGNVTVVQGNNRPAPGAAPVGSASNGGASAPPPYPDSRMSNSEQRVRDTDARAILESELRKAQARHAELLKEYDNGSTERSALDLRNPQRYLERTDELKASVARSESDIASIKREIARLPTTVPAD